MADKKIGGWASKAKAHSKKDEKFSAEDFSAEEIEVLEDADEETLSAAFMEEFYNAWHDPKTGRFTFAKGGKKGKLHIPMSEAARRSNAILRGLKSARKSKEYKTASKNIKGSWAEREKGQGGLRHKGGTNSKKADAARAANAKAPAKPKVAPKPKVAEDIRPSSEAQSLTQRYGTRSRPVPTAQKKDRKRYRPIPKTTWDYWNE